jgi:hypothetical protein
MSRGGSWRKQQFFRVKLCAADSRLRWGIASLVWPVESRCCNTLKPEHSLV